MNCSLNMTVRLLLLQIDATENDALRQRFFVGAFPTIVHLRNGKTRQYSGVPDRSQVQMNMIQSSFLFAELGVIKKSLLLRYVKSSSASF